MDGRLGDNFIFILTVGIPGTRFIPRHDTVPLRAGSRSSRPDPKCSYGRPIPLLNNTGDTNPPTNRNSETRLLFEPPRDHP